jgi:hypothetical protein
MQKTPLHERAGFFVASDPDYRTAKVVDENENIFYFAT